MKKVEIKVYEYKELNDNAKLKAADFIHDDESETDFIVDEMLMKLNENGFTDATVAWSLSCCQGDGVSFTGKWYSDDVEKIIKNAYNGNIPLKVRRILHNIYSINFHRLPSFYVHENTVGVDILLEQDVYGTYIRIQKLMEEIEKVINDFRVKVCKELENRGYAIVEYYNSDEYLQERCDNNGYCFLKDGKLIYA